MANTIKSPSGICNHKDRQMPRKQLVVRMPFACDITFHAESMLQVCAVDSSVKFEAVQIVDGQGSRIDFS